jgi:cytochrome c-type biogenesis protein CcmH/NrfG
MTSSLHDDELAALEEERDFLLASLDDLERERDAGDIDDDDYAALREDYTARAAAAVRAVRQQRREIAAAGRQPGKKRLIAGVMAALLLAVIAGVLVAQFSGRRQAGQQVSGNIAQANGTPAATGTAASAQPDAATQKCMVKMSQAFGGTSGATPTGSPVDALRCFDAVLKGDSNNVAALTFRGWTGVQLARELSASGADPSQVSTIVQSATGNLQQALKLAPKDPTALLFSAYDAFYAGDDASAKGLLARFDALGLASDPTLSSLVDPLRQALADDANSASSSPTSAAPAPSSSTP